MEQDFDSCRINLRFAYQQNIYALKHSVSITAWNFFLKKIYAEYTIRRRQKRDKLRLIHENEKRFECEAPKILPTEDSSDSQLICGHDDNGNSILIKFTRRRHRVAEIWLLLKLANGQTYTFPDHPNTKIVNATPRVFEGSGLKLECLAPYSKWRISYSGMLRRGIAQNVSDDEEEFYYAKFNFMLELFASCFVFRS